MPDAPVDLVVAIKALDRAKSRLLGAADAGRRGRREHEALALAIASDTVDVAARAGRVRTVLVVSSDETVAAAMAELGVEVLPDPHGAGGLNAALRRGFAALRARDAHSVAGALQSDLPALRPEELDAALVAARGRRAFCADRHGTGTALLLTAAGGPLDPAFGEGSAAAHLRSGALAVAGELPGLRTDVDTAADLDLAVTLGAGPRTARALAACAG